MDCESVMKATAFVQAKGIALRRARFRTAVIAWITGLAISGCRSTPPSATGFPVFPAAVERHHASGEVGLPAAPVFSFDALVNAARQHNPELLALQDAMESARAEAVTATGLRNPELRVEYGEGSRLTGRTWYRSSVPPEPGRPAGVPQGTIRHEDVDSDAVRFGLRLFPPNPWLLRAQGACSRARFAAAAAELQAGEWRLECAIGKALSEMRTLGHELEVVRQQASLRREYADAVSSRMKQQQATALDELDARQRLLRATEDVAQLEQALLQKEQWLTELSGVAPGQSGEAGGLPVAGVAPGAVSGLDGRLFESRQDVMAAYWRHQGAIALLRESKSRRIPWLAHVQGSYARGSSEEQVEAMAAFSSGFPGAPADGFTTDRGEDEEWSIEAALEIPVFAFHAGASRVERVELARCARLLRETVRRAGMELETSRSQWKAAAERAGQCQAELDGIQQETSKLGRALEQAGLWGPEEQLKVREMMLQTRRAAIRTAGEKEAAFWRLREASGQRIEAGPPPP